MKSRHLEVFPDKRKGKKDSWNWNCSEHSRRKKGAMNVLYTAQGYDSKGIAIRRAREHNKRLIRPLPIMVYDGKNGITWYEL